MNPVDTIDSVLQLKGRQLWSWIRRRPFTKLSKKCPPRAWGAAGHGMGKLVGIVSERDYARKVILKDRSSKHTEVREIMTCPVISVTPKHTVEECMRMVTEHRIRHLPVMDGERMVGIISIGDLVNWIITAHEETIGHLQNYIEGRYPA